MLLSKYCILTWNILIEKPVLTVAKHLFKKKKITYLPFLEE